MSTLVQMDFDEWVQQFRPVLVNASGVDIEAYLIDGARTAEQGPLHRASADCVWSFIEGDGIEGIIEGVDEHAIGYLVTQVPAVAGQTYAITYSMDDEYWDDAMMEEHNYKEE